MYKIWWNSINLFSRYWAETKLWRNDGQPKSNIDVVPTFSEDEIFGLINIKMPSILPYIMLHTKFECHRTFGSNGFYPTCIWSWQSSWSCDQDQMYKVSLHSLYMKFQFCSSYGFWEKYTKTKFYWSLFQLIISDQTLKKLKRFFASICVF